MMPMMDLNDANLPNPPNPKPQDFAARDADLSLATKLQEACQLPPLRICADLPGTGGMLKSVPEDFEVEEIPAYAPSGSGEHLFLWLQKCGVPAMALVDHVARALDISARDIGCAGLKDARAVTRQFLSVPASCAPNLDRIDDGNRIKLLHSALHGNKLKTGHLRGNRFHVVVRDVGDAALARAQAIVARLTTLGLPNFFGAQRMGYRGHTVALGLGLIGAAPAPPGRLGRSQVRLALSAVQAAVFNAGLRARMEAGLLHQVVDGDVCQVCVSGGPFVVDDVGREQTRFDGREIVPTGPMVGPKMRAATGAACEMELAVMAQFGLQAQQFAGHGKLMQGTRRPYLIWPDAIEVTALPDSGLRLSFSLPPGSYATGVLAEVMG